MNYGYSLHEKIQIDLMKVLNGTKIKKKDWAMNF